MGGQVTGTEPESRDVGDETDDSTPALIGRYSIVRRIGRGAMGTVYEAYDPELARKVALKVLGRVVGDSAAQTWRRDRLRREAQALAQLSHENVVSVYDAGVVCLGDSDERVYLSMQFVEGDDLAHWLRVHPVATRSRRDRRAVVDMFVKAGRGLAAAHEVDLVHRDFKPANVLIGDDGTVRVADFGLARSAAGARPRDAEGESETGSESSTPQPLLATMTMPGAVMGTPPYMSPEQFLGDEVDSRSDQFAFCVALHEALYGQRPFAGRTFSSLRRNVTRGHMEPPSANVRVPGRLRRVVLRGLRTDPDGRYPSMSALVADLERDPTAGLRRALSVLGVAVVIGAVAVAVVARRSGARDTRCTRGADHLVGVWDAPRKAAIRAAFIGTGKVRAKDVFERLSRRLDTHFAAWVAARANTCAATHIRGEQSAAVMDLRMRCLDRRLSEARALVTLLGTRPDAAMLDEAIYAAARLPGLEQCDSVETLRAVVPPPADPQTRARVVSLDRRLDHLVALRDAGKYRRGLELAGDVTREAATLGYAPVHARALAVQAELEVLKGNFAAAENTYQEAARAAGAARDDRLLAKILTALVSLVGGRQGDDKNTNMLATLAESTLARVGTPPAMLAELFTSRGTALHAQAKYVEAQRYFERSLALRRKALGDNHPDVARSLNAIAVTLYYQQKLPEAET